MVRESSFHKQGRGNYFEVGGEGQASPGVQGNPYPKTKNSPDLAHYFLVETEVHVQKQTKIKMNDFHSPKLGGGAPTASKLWRQVAPTAPPPPVPASLSINTLLTIALIYIYVIQGRSKI